jgi:hypothetical protein
VLPVAEPPAPDPACRQPVTVTVLLLPLRLLCSLDELEVCAVAAATDAAAMAIVAAVQMFRFMNIPPRRHIAIATPPAPLLFRTNRVDVSRYLRRVRRRCGKDNCCRTKRGHSSRAPRSQRYVALNCIDGNRRRWFSRPFTGDRWR